MERFEDIEAWRKARELTGEIYKVTATGEFSRDFGLRDQIRRAAVSIMSNIAEGFERGGNKEFRQFLAYAKGSAGEVKAQLYVAFDVGFIDQERFSKLAGLLDEIGRLIGGFICFVLGNLGLFSFQYIICNYSLIVFLLWEKVKEKFL